MKSELDDRDEVGNALCKDLDKLLPPNRQAGDDEVPEVTGKARGKGKGAGRSGAAAGADNGPTGRGRGNARWDYTGWETWLTKDEDVNLPKDVANAKSRMRKAAAKAVFKARKGSRWL